MGIYLDQFLKWDSHVNFTVSRIKYLTFVFYKLRYLDNFILKLIYDSLFLSIASYGISVWGSAYNNSLRILQSYQNKITKFMRNSSDLSGYLNIKQLFVLNSLLFYYDDFTQRYTQSSSKSRNKTLILPKIKKSVFRNSSLIVAMNTFNSLPKNLMICHHKTQNKRKKVFKSQLFA